MLVGDYKQGAMEGSGKLSFCINHIFLGWRGKVSILILRTDYPKQRPTYAQIHSTYFLAAYSSSTYLV